MSRSPKLPNIDVEERFLAQVAWADHFEGLTQEQVAEKLNVTRLRVNKALAEADLVFFLGSSAGGRCGARHASSEAQRASTAVRQRSRPQLPGARAPACRG
jgi:hypothetical protein